MVIAGAPECSPVCAAVASTVPERPPSERGTETTATKPPLPPAPMTAKADAEILHLPEPGLQVVVAPPSAQADQQARAPSVSPPAAPAALPAVTADVPDSAAGPPAAAPSAPPAGVALAVVADAVTPKPAVCYLIRSVARNLLPADPLVRTRPPHAMRERQFGAGGILLGAANRRRGGLRIAGGVVVGGGGRGYGGGWRGDDAPASIADVRHIVTAAIRDGRTGSASQSSSLRATPSPADPHRGVPPVVAPVAAELLPATPGAPTSASPGNAASARLRLPRVPPVAGMEFVSTGGGVVRAQYPPLVAVDPDPSAVDEALPYLAEGLLPPYVHVPEATLGQLWWLSESLRVILLVQVLAHASLPSLPAESLQDGPRDDCLDAADQLALLLAPVLAAPAQGGVGAVSQLDAAVRGLRRYLRAGSGASAISTSTLVVREVWRTMQGILHALQADRM
ncbi:unnamed protein product [Closterium sp. Naga37s-1]|nr:unnamed protein product [Closterium sp. Naga37s-1]